jgi:hypothetical protein
MKQAVSGMTGGWHGEVGSGTDDVRREGSDVVAGDGSAPVNFSSLMESIAKSFSF